MRSQVNNPHAPQSNQRGIETRLQEVISNILLVPQSNQRGIETSIRAPRGPVRHRLNRTSVGLKQLQHGDPGGRDLCLNRTSVGLKRYSRGQFDVLSRLPQSNQRGIETPVTWISLKLNLMASIEPAWD